MSDLFPAFLKLQGRSALLVGGGRVAASKLTSLVQAGALVTVVAPRIAAELQQPGVDLLQRPFEPADLDGRWFAVAAATREVNRQVAEAAEVRRLFLNAADDPQSASAYLGGVVRKAGVTLAISTGGRTPALAGLLREALETFLPEELGAWISLAEKMRARWREEGVPMAARRPLLLRALEGLYFVTGLVSLVGAGPGDPELLTLRAVSRLQAADLVLYDALVDRAALWHAPHARLAYVGKRAGRHSISQQTIERVMIRRALRGERVVRLKSGDPFVFGRGAEEALALAAAGVPCEVVPGVSSATAGPLLSGIPVTHRGMTSAFLVVSGHAEAAFAPVLGSLPPGAATVVVMMGLASRADTATLLLSRGWDPATPAAVLLAAATAEARSWRGTLAELGACDLPERHPDLAGLLVVGATVAVADQLEALAATVPAARPLGPLARSTAVEGKRLVPAGTTVVAR